MRISKELANRVVLLPATTLIAICALLNVVAEAQGDGKPATTINPQPASRAVTVNIPRIEGAPQLADFLDMKPAAGVAQQMSKIEGFVQLDPTEARPHSRKPKSTSVTTPRIFTRCSFVLTLSQGRSGHA